MFFSDAKRHLGLADCSCRDFTSQLAYVSVGIVRYNLMAYIKRFHDYETIGALFKEIHLGVKELTVVESIWEAIVEVVAVVAELFSVRPKSPIFYSGFSDRFDYHLNLVN